MTANLRIRENRKIPHTCDPYDDFKHPRDAKPGDLWECPPRPHLDQQPRDQPLHLV